MAEIVGITDFSPTDLQWDAWKVPQRDLLLMSVQIAPDDVVFGYMRRATVSAVGGGADPFIYDNNEFGFERGLATPSLRTGSLNDIDSEYDVLRSFPSFGCHHSGLLICDAAVADWPSSDINVAGAYCLKVGDARGILDTGFGTTIRDGYVYSTAANSENSPHRRLAIPTLIAGRVDEGIRPITMQYTSEQALLDIMRDPEHNLRRAPMHASTSEGLKTTEEFGTLSNRKLHVIGASILTSTGGFNAVVMYVDPSSDGNLLSQKEMTAQLTGADFNGFGTYDIRAKALFIAPNKGAARVKDYRAGLYASNDKAVVYERRRGRLGRGGGDDYDPDD